MNKTPVMIGSSLSAIGSSLVVKFAAFCCIGPAVIAVLGTSGALTAATLAPYRPYFIIDWVLLLGLGFWLAYRPQGGCIWKTCATTPQRSLGCSSGLLWLLPWQLFFFLSLCADDGDEEDSSHCGYRISFPLGRVYAPRLREALQDDWR